MRDKLLFEIDVRLNPEKRRELNTALASLTTGVGSGHLRTSVYEERDDPNRLLWVMEWADQVSLEAYLASTFYHELMGCLKTLGEVTDRRIVQPQKGEVTEQGVIVNRLRINA